MSDPKAVLERMREALHRGTREPILQEGIDALAASIQEAYDLGTRLKRLAFEAQAYLDVIHPHKPDEADVVVSAGFVRRVVSSGPVGAPLAETEYMLFEEAPNPRRTTRRITVVNKSGRYPLGYLRWHSPWRQYVFEPEAGAIFNDDCLVSLLDGVRHLNAQQKATR